MFIKVMGNINSRIKNAKQIKNIGHTLTEFEKKDYAKRQQRKQNESDSVTQAYNPIHTVDPSK